MRPKTKPQISVVIPTFNEAENLPVLVPRISAALRKIPHEIIIADDNSPDGTYAVALKLRAKYPQLKAICRTHNKGLSPAVIDGFAVAEAEFMVVMDADLQHDEKILPEFLVRFSRGDQLVIASRKVQGGGVEGWSWVRRFISWGATLIARLFLPGLPSDPMSGYFGVSAELYRKIAGDINPRGFKILLEIFALSRGVRLSEIGYVFRPREMGESKLSGSVMLSFLAALYDLRFGRFLPLEYVKYSLVGLFGLAVNETVLFVLKQKFNLPNESAILPAIEAALLCNFFINNLFTFRAQRLVGLGKILRGLVTFHLICLLGAYINYAVALHLSAFVHVNIYLANAAGVVIASFWNFFINAQVIWRRG